jgi:Sulfotransferase family
MKVLYILGTQRGGTTIAGRILGLISGVAYAGEVRRLWEFGVAPERRCGCGELLADCPVWSVVLDRVRAAGINPVDVAAWQQEVAPARDSWRSPSAIQGSHARGSVAFSGYVRALIATYEGLAEAYRVKVLIDNSKLPADGAFLLHASGIAPYYLHIVRDARGVVASQLRRRSTNPLERSVDATVLAASWIVRHARSSQVESALGPGHHVRVRYEDFVADPGATASAICRLLELPRQSIGPSPFELPAVHTPRGPNPATNTALVEDTGWRSELNLLERGLITTITAPWLLRNGYLWQGRGVRIAPDRDHGGRRHPPRGDNGSGSGEEP